VSTKRVNKLHFVKLVLACTAKLSVTVVVHRSFMIATGIAISGSDTDL